MGAEDRVREDGEKARTLITSALLGELSRRVLEYENAITWGTSCLSCAGVLDSAYAETVRREKAEAQLAEIDGMCRGIKASAPGGVVPVVAVDRVLAVIGTGERGRDPAAGRVPEAEAGAAMIRAERLRQVAVEGWTPEHDAHHTAGELARAAACYAAPPEYRKTRTALADGRGDDRGDRYRQVPQGWPWHPDFWKPGDRLSELVRAGALIAAEIDRLIAEEARDG